MTPERWQQIDKLLEQALEQDPGSRAAFLDEACNGDAALRQEVESLLSAHGKAEGFSEAGFRQTPEKRTDVEEAESLTGRHIVHYQILSRLGEGGMGVVYKARDQHLDRFVAIKVLPPELVADPDRKRRFVQEAKAASALNHPNIITIHDIASENSRDFIVMEFVKGKTLGQVILRRGLKLSEVLKYAIQIADALAKAHAAGIIHRDLKPGNIMVSEAGLVKLLDFGLAKLTERPLLEGESTGSLPLQTEEGMIVGTASYMSPEQGEGKNLDARSDIFSFGSLLYEMTTGRRAFQGDSKMSTLAAIIHKEPEPLSAKIPRDLEKVISRCLRKDIHRRFQHMDDVKIALEELKDESDSGTLEATGSSPGVAVRGKLWWAVMLVAVAVTAVGIAVRLWLNRFDRTLEQTQLTAVPLTTYRGFETSPSLSPDGTQVAFQWCQEDQNCHIYIKQVGVEPPFQLTNSGLDEAHPAWSPDGRFIAFIRSWESKRVAVILIPQRGGSERQLASYDLSLSGMSVIPDPPQEHRCCAAEALGSGYLAWTPDSQWVAFSYTEGDQKNTALLLMSVNTGEKRWLTTAPVGEGDSAPAFSPDGGTLAFIRQRENDSDLYVLHLREGYWPQSEPERVPTGNPINGSPVWMPDGRELVILSGTLKDTMLYRITVSNPTKPVRLNVTSENPSGASISKTGKRLVYSVSKDDSNIWRVDLGGPGGMPGSPVELISSTREEGDPAYSPTARGSLTGRGGLEGRKSGSVTVKDGTRYSSLPVLAPFRD